MIFIGFSLMFMDFHWIFGFHWFSLTSIDFHWFSWRFMDFPLIPLIFIDFYWNFNDFYWCLLIFIRFSMIFIWFPWIVNDFHSIFNDFHGLPFDFHSIFVDVHWCSLDFQWFSWIFNDFQGEQGHHHPQAAEGCEWGPMGAESCGGGWDPGLVFEGSPTRNIIFSSLNTHPQEADGRRRLSDTS